ncbi:hypothetical protein PLCT2_01720 [Planctomycetaceae bacterium]|nr:hypothetical protein PLCT2_01720 [Planctomycetaceae bacterium]
MDIETLLVVKGVTIGFSAGLAFGWLLSWLNFRDSSSSSNHSQDKEQK